MGKETGGGEAFGKNWSMTVTTRTGKGGPWAEKKQEGSELV
jgi:hypothetical protein